ncbi:MAG: hypothetical protein M1833_003967 [Piccolia ochrophora]|nr:MAG: hypothetical protein M1833_003967 [Piccolia ochrophora]
MSPPAPPLVPAIPLPTHTIPSSSSTVSVKIIDSTARISFPLSRFLTPPVPGLEVGTGPAYSFLIEHQDKDGGGGNRRFLFDLGIRKDWEGLAPRIVGTIREGKASGWNIEAEKDVAEVLEEEGVKRESIEGVIWSHHHFDHVGNMTTFPASTDLIVGPGFKEGMTPGYPENSESSLLQSDYEGRTVREIDFQKEGNGLKIGSFAALDFFNDGSFYLLDSPGHAIGHICGLARTTSNPATFILMGGDVCHHGGEFRPTKYLPLPSEISPNPLNPAAGASPCPGALLQGVHPAGKANEPFFEISQGEDGSSVAHDKEQATQSIRKVEEFDPRADVFVVIAHDQSLLDVMEFFPKEANAWQEKGWAEKGKWLFLADFKEAVERKK